MASKRIDEKALEVLRQCSVDGDKVFIPQALDRYTYDRVNKVLVSLGGKWNTKEKAHLFPYPIDVEYTEMLGTGIMPDRNPLSFYRTPLAVVQQMIRRADLLSVNWRTLPVLEPSAGEGDIVSVLLQDGVLDNLITAIEANGNREAKLVYDFPKVHVVHADYMYYIPDRRFSACLMNPPFNTPTIKNAWVDHVKKAMDESDIVVAVVPASIEFSKLDKIQRLRDRVNELSGVIVRLDDGAFKTSGLPQLSTNIIAVKTI